MFSTGSGHTTIGEVVIVPDSATFLEIEPYNEKDLKDYIKEFCDYIWFKVSPSPDEKDGAGGKLSYELEKAIRNITGLTSQSSEVEDGDEQEQKTPDNTIQEGPGSAKGKRKIRIDPAEELARQFASDQSEDFFAAVVGKANLENRVETRIDYDASLNKTEQEKSWLRETFEKINLGRLPNFSVPRRVIAHVSARILDLSDYPQIGSIIDTRGIATDISREDLETYIRSRDDTLCIFTDLFPQAPSTIADLMKRFLIAEAHDLATKSMLMVLYKKGEPEKVHDTGGEVEDQEEGIAVKRATIEQELHTQQINLPADNILFYDALQYYDEYKRFNQDYEEEDIQEKRHYILQNINSILERRETKLWNEIQELEQRYQSIQKGRGLDPEDEALINQVREEIKGYHHQNFIVTDFIEQYIGTWMPKYPTRLRAVNNRHGIYDDINIYVVVKGLVEGMVRKLFQRPKNKVFEAIGRMNQPGASTNLKPFIEAFLIQVDAYYEELIEKVGEETVTFLKGKVFAPQSDGNNFWYSVQNRWGKGPGYKDDVIKTYENELEKADATGRLQEIGERLWREIFFDRVLRFFQ